jgi:hypothetical protein
VQHIDNAQGFWHPSKSNGAHRPIVRFHRFNDGHHPRIIFIDSTTGIIRASSSSHRPTLASIKIKRRASRPTVHIVLRFHRFIKKKTF